MATLKELMGDLTRGDGRRFFNLRTRQIFEPIYFSCPNWFGLCSDKYSYYFDENKPEWDFDEKSTFKKKVKLYRPIYLDTNRVSYGTHSKWESNKSYFYDYDFQKIVGWQEMEVEVDN